MNEHLCPCCQETQTLTSICAGCVQKLTNKGLLVPAPNGKWNPSIHGRSPIEALIRWRDAGTDLYGEEGVGFISHCLRHDDLLDLPEYLHGALKEFRALSDGESWDLVESVLEGISPNLKMTTDEKVKTTSYDLQHIRYVFEGYRAQILGIKQSGHTYTAGSVQLVFWEMGWMLAQQDKTFGSLPK